jgi:hypothetical protein
MKLEITIKGIPELQRALKERVSEPGQGRVARNMAMAAARVVARHARGDGYSSSREQASVSATLVAPLRKGVDAGSGRAYYERGLGEPRSQPQLERMLYWTALGRLSATGWRGLVGRLRVRGRRAHPAELLANQSHKPGVNGGYHSPTGQQSVSEGS